MSLINPQNPYISCIVQASAGSGKTYQLSRRFLHLVSAGAEPSEILTITFTKKAAQEMRGRIIKEAADILVSSSRKKELESTMADYYKSHQSRADISISPPLSAEETAKKILSQTQSLKISTIDSLFQEWVSRYTVESSENKYPSPFNLAGEEEKEKIETTTWSNLFNNLISKKNSPLEDLSPEEQSLRLSLEILQETNPEFKVSQIRSSIADLIQNESIIWKSSLTGNPIIEYQEKDLGFTDELNAIQPIFPELQKIVETSTSPEKYRSILQADSLSDLTNHKIITKAFKVSGSIIRGKKRDTLEEEISIVEEHLSTILDEEAKKRLNITAKCLINVFNSWTAIKEKNKKSDSILEFSDISKGAYTLLHSEDGQGATWLIQKKISHLLLDEFQDTSLLQWDIFKRLTSELINNRNETLGYPNTAFIVGDIKQSIYGFRQADPTVMEDASNYLTSNGQYSIPMNTSYRTANTILEYVNIVFKKLMGDDFPNHSTAEINGKPFVNDTAKVIVFNKFENTEQGEKTLKSIDNETETIAEFIKHALSNPKEYPVLDAGRYRPLRPSDIAILYKNKTKSDEFEKALRKHGINSIKEEKNGYFQRQEIEDLYSLINLFVYPDDTLALLSVLRSPIFNLKDSQIISTIERIKLESNKIESSKTLEQFLESAPKNISFELEYLKTALVGKAPQSFREKITDCIIHLKISEKYHELYDSKEALLAKNNIHKFIQILFNIEQEGITTPKEVLTKLRNLRQIDIEGNAPSESSAVKMMTIHKSKGLEFPMVFVVETAQKWFKKNSNWEAFKVDENQTKMCFLGDKQSRKFPSTTLEEYNTAITNNLYNESVRVLYVAMTRASQYLVITGNQRTSSEDEMSFYDTLYTSLKDMGGIVQNDDRLIYSTSQPEISFEFATGESKKEFNILSDSKHTEALARDLELVSPHSLIEKSIQTSTIQSVSKPPTEHSTALGLYFHKIMEVAVRNNSFPDEAAINYIESQFFNHYVKNDSLIKWIELFTNDARNTYNNIIKPMTVDSLKSLPEVNMINLQESNLVKGICDLVIECDDTIHIIDYKTTGPRDHEKHWSIVYKKDITNN